MSADRDVAQADEVEQVPGSPDHAPAIGPAEPDRVARLRAEADEAARVRELRTHPDVIALQVEKVRVQVERLMWVGIVLGLGFTMTNVQAFAAGGAPPWSPVWVVAWLLDPMISLVLIAILRAEQITSRYQIKTGPWVRTAKWVTLTATLAMNTWTSVVELNVGDIVKHAVPVAVVFVAAEAITDLQHKLTAAVHRAAAALAPPPGEPELVAPAPGDCTAAPDSRDPVPADATTPAVDRPQPAEQHIDDLDLDQPDDETGVDAAGDRPEGDALDDELRRADRDDRVHLILGWLSAGEELEGKDVAERLSHQYPDRPLRERSGRRLLKLAKDLHEHGVAPRPIGPLGRDDVSSGYQPQARRPDTTPSTNSAGEQPGPLRDRWGPLRGPTGGDGSRRLTAVTPDPTPSKRGETA